MSAVLSMPLCLTRDELHDLTGLKQGAAQIRWLTKYGYPFVVRADGKPRVVRAALEGRSADQPRQKTRPNYAAFG